MSQKAIVDFVSDSDENQVLPSPQSVHRSSRIQTRESPWSQLPSEKIVSILEEAGFPVSNDLSRNDLILLTSNILGTSATPPEDDT